MARPKKDFEQDVKNWINEALSKEQKGEDAPTINISNIAKQFGLSRGTIYARKPLLSTINRAEEQQKVLRREDPQKRPAWYNRMQSLREELEQMRTRNMELVKRLALVEANARTLGIEDPNLLYKELPKFE